MAGSASGLQRACARGEKTQGAGEEGRAGEITSRATRTESSTKRRNDEISILKQAVAARAESGGSTSKIKQVSVGAKRRAKDGPKCTWLETQAWSQGKQPKS